MYETIEVTREGRVETIAINRPKCNNALDETTYRELIAAFEAAGADNDLGAIVLTGKGKSFCSGGDIRTFKQLIDSGAYLSQEDLELATKLSSAIRDCPKPIVAAVNGYAMGAGVSLVAACDFRVMDADTKLSMAFINMGLTGDTGGIYLLTRVAGLAAATQMLMTGDIVSGTEAYRLGFANVLVESGQLAEEAAKLAAKLASNSTAAIAAQKRIINKYFFGEGLEAYYRDECAEMVAASRRPDFAEAVNAFLEHRRPKFNQD